MSLDRVRAAVMDQARAEADRLAADAKAETDKLAADGRAADDRVRADALRDAKQRTDRELARELGRVKQEGRMALLAAKNDQMNRAFADARAKFAALPDAERADVASAWIAALPADAGGSLRVNPKDVAAFRSRLDALNKGRDGAGRFTGVEADPAVAAGAWVVGGDFTADCTLDRRLEQLRESAVADVAAALFGANS